MKSDLASIFDNFFDEIDWYTKLLEKEIRFGEFIEVFERTAKVMAQHLGLYPGE